ncbi:polyketide synthase [Streptomyces sp. AM 4-1-1]|uniref:beta-ketoacyl [acyl carrier protein] synthase domain-containing protein n=1 Tax=Streptomyces sp. AM 4-1-1 TaxID=3028710 RepID=UPI0023B93F1A|nr:polyketide synthase [Streptomyces sp. AM 4-1-1]WEH36341.1 polyketide synthase [Streptomyces sp. AM 4-1-1]
MKEYIESLQQLSKSQLVLALARQRLRETERIAVVGMACRFPGRIDTPEEYWDALARGRSVLTEPRGIPTDSAGRPRWNVSAPDLAPLAGLLGQGAYLDSVDLFDAERFGIPDEEADHMDPQQRLLLTCAAEALDEAGPFDRSARVGVFAGVSTVEYTFACLRNGLGVDGLSPYMGTGGALSATAARVATGLHLNGPVLTVDTACSSALVAAHLAVSALRRGDCDMAVIGACHLMLAPFTTGVFDRAGMLSPTGRSRPFDAAADGHVRGEGCGVLVLKRERDAKADGDLPYAFIRASDIHQQGDRPSMAAVSAVAQRRVMSQALAESGLDPHQVHYIEAQANGSQLGGVIEAETIAEVYRRTDPGAPPLHLGSAKANLGYLETASGAAGLIKVALALSHRTVPPQPGVDRPDPAVPWERLSLTMPRAALPWPAEGPPTAAVSAFGFTGTNAHVLMQGADTPQPRPAPRRTVTKGRAHWPAENIWR